VKQELPSVQVALVGAMEAADDIKAMEILKDIQEKSGADPDIHLLYDPDVITHPIVHAFQHYSSVILQRSIREGFGLTVTEAMWKYQPVVGTSVAPTRQASPRARQEAVSLPRNGVAIPRCTHKSS
jgi:trehalose synthase